MEAGVVEGRATADPACAGCGGPLANDQRYCLNCGKRIGGCRIPGSQVAAVSRPAPRQPSLLRLPAPRSAGALAALTLGFGVFVGLAMGPALPGGLLAGGRLRHRASARRRRGCIRTSPSRPPHSSGPVGNVAGGRWSGARQGGRSNTRLHRRRRRSRAERPGSSTAGGGGPGPGPGPTGPQGLPPGPPDLADRRWHRRPRQPGREELLGGHHRRPAGPHPRRRPAGPTHQRERRRAGAVQRDLRRARRAGTTEGVSDHATFAGTVTYLDPDAGVYTVSVAGASVLVHAPETGSDPPDLPELATEVSVDVTIDLPSASAHASDRSARAPGRSAPPRLWPPPPTDATREPLPGPEPVISCSWSAASSSRACRSGRSTSRGSSSEPVPPRTSWSCPRTTSGSRGATSRSISPADIDLSLLELGKSVNATVTIDDDGSYELTGVSSDDGAAGADDPSAGQGDQADQ